MNKTIKERIADEQATLWNCWHNYNNYCEVINIEEFGKIRLVYNKIETGHKTRAKRLFDDLLADTKSKLPSWVIEYFYGYTLFNTFNAWQKHGRVVKKGEKSFMKNKEGIALFAEDQTVIPEQVKRARETLINAIYSANEDAPYDEDYADYDAINKELQAWNGTVSYPLKKKPVEPTKSYEAYNLPEYDQSDNLYYEYEPEW